MLAFAAIVLLLLLLVLVLVLALLLLMLLLMLELVLELALVLTAVAVLASLLAVEIGSDPAAGELPPLQPVSHEPTTNSSKAVRCLLEHFANME